MQSMSTTALSATASRLFNSIPTTPTPISVAPMRFATNANTVSGVFGRALAFGAKGEYDRAIQDYSIVIERNPRDPVALNNRGVLYEKIRNYDRAIRDFDGAIALNAKYDLAIANRCLTYNRKNQFDRAVEDCSRAIELNPGYATAYVTEGKAF